MTAVPGAPLLGDSPESVGGAPIVKLPAVTVPPDVVTVTGPLVAGPGT